MMSCDPGDWVTATGWEPMGAGDQWLIVRSAPSSSEGTTLGVMDQWNFAAQNTHDFSPGGDNPGIRFFTICADMP
jgi:hypothetical protein